MAVWVSETETVSDPACPPAKVTLELEFAARVRASAGNVAHTGIVREGLLAEVLATVTRLRRTHPQLDRACLIRGKRGSRAGNSVGFYSAILVICTLNSAFGSRDISSKTR